MNNRVVFLSGGIVILILAGVFYFKGMPGYNQSAASAMPQQNQTAETQTNSPTSSVMADTTTKSNVKEFTVAGQNFSFTPKEISVNKGDTVKITFKNAEGFHNFVIDEFNVKTNTIKGGSEETVQFTADKTGSFQYYCSVGTHRAMGMWGTLKVN